MAKTFDKSKLEEVKGTDEIVTVSYEDKEVFMAECPVEKDTVIDVFKHSQSFIKDATEFAANYSTEKFKEDEKLQKVIIDIPYGPTGTGSVSVAAVREKSFRVPGSDRIITRPDITTKVTHQALKAGKKHIDGLQDAMLEALKK